MWIPFVHRKCKVCLLESSGISSCSNISHRYWVEGRTSWCSHFSEGLGDTEDPVLVTVEQAWSVNRWVRASMGRHFLCPITPYILGKGHKIVSWSKTVIFPFSMDYHSTASCQYLQPLFSCQSSQKKLQSLQSHVCCRIKLLALCARSAVIGAAYAILLILLTQRLLSIESIPLIRFLSRSLFFQLGDKIRKAELENTDLRERLKTLIRQYTTVMDEEEKVFLQKQKISDEYASPLLATASGAHMVAHLSPSSLSTLLTTRRSFFDNQLAYF